MSQFELKTDPDSGKFGGYQERKPAGNLRIYPSLDSDGQTGMKPELDHLHGLETLADRYPLSPSPRLGFDAGIEDPFQKPYDLSRRPCSLDKPKVTFDLNAPQEWDSSPRDTFLRNDFASKAYSAYEAPDSFSNRHYGPSVTIAPRTTTSYSSGNLLSNAHATQNIRPRVSTNPFHSTQTFGSGSSLPATPYPVHANPLAYIANNVSGGAVRRREMEPDYYDGSADLNDYLEHFEQVAEYNGWSDDQRARALCTRLKGDARKILRSLSMLEKTDYGLLQMALAREFDMQEMVMAHRSVYKNRRRKKDETVAQFGFELRRLAQKAYPALSLRELEVHIIDQYLEGLGDKELRKHVQLHHPQTLSQAIGLAVEYCSVDNPNDKLLKPTKDRDEPTLTQSEKMRSVNSLRPLNYQTEFSVQDLQNIISSVVEQKMGELRNELKGPVSAGSFAPKDSEITRVDKQNPFHGEQNRSQGQRTNDRREHETDIGGRRRRRKDIICSFCGKNNHVESRCFEKQRVMGEQQNKKTSMSEN